VSTHEGDGGSPLASLPSAKRPWIESDRRLARFVAQPFSSFLHTESSSGLLLLAAAVVAVAWANSPWDASYVDLWHSEVVVQVGEHTLFAEDLQHLVNDGLMAVFFLVVGCEIKRELVTGELRDRRRAALPAIAALGGMVLPAVIFLGFNLGGPAARGWGIPMATDIAFAVGLVAVLGRRVQPSMKLFLLTLAIVDDIGAIVVIAVFYSDGIQLGWLAGAAALLALMGVARRANVVSTPFYVVLGVLVWYLTFRSGVHATVAGVALGLLAPAKPLQDEVQAEAVADQLEGKADITVEDVRVTGFLIRESVPVGTRIEQALHPWSAYLIVPIFALANAGVVISSSAVDGSTSLVLGVVLGLVVGKTVGVSSFAWLGHRLGLGSLPPGTRARDLLGISAAAGIGFTVSLFVADLAFRRAELQDAAKIGVLAASVIAAIVASILLWSFPLKEALPGHRADRPDDESPNDDESSETETSDRRMRAL
jgi:NhaA family Na+:H+ antiporter